MHWQGRVGTKNEQYIQLKAETPLGWGHDQACVTATSLSYFKSMEAMKHEYMHFNTAIDTCRAVRGDTSGVSFPT
jgi:hypothetical protein